MGDYVIKADEDEDLYVIWNTTADGLAYAGTREEIRQQLWREYKRHHPHSTPHAGWSPDDAMARADANGTSARDGAYGWGYTSFYVWAGAPGNGYELARSNLLAYARAILADDAPAALALLVKGEGHRLMRTTHEEEKTDD